jgi:hypothetical protein
MGNVQGLNSFSIIGTVREIVQARTKSDKPIFTINVELPTWRGGTIVPVKAFGKSVEAVAAFTKGSLVTITCHLDANEHNGKYYTDVLVDEASVLVHGAKAQLKEWGGGGGDADGDDV